MTISLLPFTTPIRQTKQLNKGSAIVAANSKLLTTSILSFIKDKILVDKFSPAAIAHLLKGKLCFKSIYNYLERGIINVSHLDLTRKVRYHRLKSKFGIHKKIFGTSIDKRPNYINNKRVFGHWEGDCVFDKNGKSSILTLVERKTNQGLIFKLKQKQSFNVMFVLQNLILKKNTFSKALHLTMVQNFPNVTN